MSTATSIEWTDATWNPVRGCSRVSQGCVNCYAEAVAARFSGPGAPFEGFAKMTPAGPRWTGKVDLVEKHLADPLRWKKPRRVFVNSMSDLFYEALPDEAIDRVFAVMTCAQQHTFQVLTKRPERMRSYLADGTGANNVLKRILDAARSMPKPRGWTAPEAHGWPYRNVWLGVSVEDQATADDRIPLLLQTPAAVRFVSYEPALGPVDLRGHLQEWRRDGSSFFSPVPRSSHHRKLDWIIVGGESGPHARPFDVAWARSTVAQCKAAGVACFVKQMGRWVLGDHTGFHCVQQWLFSDGSRFVPPLIGPRAWERPDNAIGFTLTDRKGGDWTEWPEDLRVREFPGLDVPPETRRGAVSPTPPR